MSTDAKNIFRSPKDLLACSGEIISIDVETTGLDFWKHELIGLGFFCPSKDERGYIPTTDEYSKAGVLDAVQKVAQNPRTTLIGHNVSFECQFLELSPRFLPCRFLDSMIMSHLEDSWQRKGLEACAARYLGIVETKRIYREAGRNQPIHKWPVELTARYCINDCIITYQLFEKLWGLLKKLDLLALLKKEMKEVGLIIEVQRRGMLLDQEFLDDAEKVIAANVVLMEHDLKDGTQQDFNWRSTQQLSRALYENMNIAKPVNPFLDERGVDVQKGRSPLFNTYNSTCTNRFLLMEKAHHPLGNLVLDLRESDKMVRNYCHQWKELLDANGIIHGQFNITGTRTGRKSSSRPNLQNVPSKYRARETQSIYSGGSIRSDDYNLRQAFVARPGYTFLSVDYKQQEMRLFALLSRDKKMIEAVKNRLDIHRYVAKMVWGVEDDLHREWSKTIGFGLLYGMTTGTLQHRLGMKPSEANAITSKYFTEFPRIMPYMAEVIQLCKKQGYLRYWSGRIWRQTDPKKLYKGVNALVQGGSADLLSIGGLRAQDWLDKTQAGHIVSWIHDEILMEIKNEALEEASREVPKIMEISDIFDAPFLTEVKTGPNYGMLS